MVIKKRGIQKLSAWSNHVAFNLDGMVDIYNLNLIRLIRKLLFVNLTLPSPMGEEWLISEEVYCSETMEVKTKKV